MGYQIPKKQDRFNEQFDAKSVGKQASNISAKNLSLFNRRNRKTSVSGAE
jgi:hypothetical protein